MKVTLHRGFTLIEVMIVVAIVAILAAVAFPSYTEYLRRGQMPEAFASLSDYRIKLEQYYQDRRNYGTGSCATPGPSWNNFSPTARKYFRFSCALTAGGQGYEMKAIGEAGRVGTPSVSKFEYTVTQAGDKKTIKFDGATVDWNCWAVKPADCP